MDGRGVRRVRSVWTAAGPTGLLIMALGLATPTVAQTPPLSPTPNPAVPKQKAPSPPAAPPAPRVPAFGGGIQAQQQSAGGPDMVTETYGDWVMRCQTAGEAKRCEVSQTILIQGQNAPIALIAFGREKKGDPLRMVVQLPTNVTFEGGVKTTTASGEAAVDMAFKRCFPVGCFADSALSDAVVTKLRAQTEPLVIKFKDGTEREIALPLSLRGFGPAVDALGRT